MASCFLTRSITVCTYHSLSSLEALTSCRGTGKASQGPIIINYHCNLDRADLPQPALLNSFSVSAIGEGVAVLSSPPCAPEGGRYSHTNHSRNKNVLGRDPRCGDEGWECSPIWKTFTCLLLLLPPQLEQPHPCGQLHDVVSNTGSQSHQRWKLRL